MKSFKIEKIFHFKEADDKHKRALEPPFISLLMFLSFSLSFSLQPNSNSDIFFCPSLLATKTE